MGPPLGVSSWRGRCGGGAAGTTWIGYDGLNRPLWRNTTNSPTNAYVSYTYDTATNGKGRVATETFNSGASLGVGSYSYTYDARGETTAESVLLDGSTYNLGFGYDDAGQQTSVTYSDSEVFALNEGSFGWLSSAQTTPVNGTTIPVVPTISYAGIGGAAGNPTSATLASGTYYTSATYDTDLRLTHRGVSVQSTGTALYVMNRGYDAVGNVTSVQTTLPAGTVNQSFCYDEQNRLTWASSYSGTGPCGIVNNGGSLTAQGAKYTASYTYDALNRLTSAPPGSYMYGDPAHLHATTGVSGGSGGGFVGKYDAAGNLSCQASCALEPTRQEIDLSYDNERRLTKWYHGGASTTVTFAYDGEGNRVAQQTNVAGTVSTTRYLAGGLEEVTTSGSPSTTTLTKYESVKGVCSVVIVGSGPSETVSYVTTDGLGSVSEALDGNGNVTAQQLFGPYGGVRYSSGTMPTAKGYTGQYADAATGLDYYHARYYDAAIGQFASADSVDAGGLNRYAYVQDDPETATDPTGHRRECQTDDSCGSGGNGGCTSNCDSGGGGGGCRTDASCGCYIGCGGISPSTSVTVLGITTNVEQERIARMLAKLDQRTEGVSGYTNKYGTDVAPYLRRPKGTLAKIKFLEEYGDWIDAASWVLVGIGFVLDAWNTAGSYYQARPDQGMGQAVAMGIAHASYVTGGALIGAAIGTAIIPIPFVGTIAGGILGAAVGGWIGDQFVAANATPNNGYSGPDDQDVPGPAAGL